MAKTIRPSFACEYSPPVGFSTMAFGSLRAGIAPVCGTVFRVRSATMTIATNTMTNTPIASRAFFCQVIESFQLPSFQLPAGEKAGIQKLKRVALLYRSWTLGT